MKRDLTFDTGMLIALSRRKSAAERLLRETRGCAVTIPVVTLAEFWRGTSRQDERVLRIDGAVIELLTPVVAKRAGEALGRLPKGTKGGAALTIDAIVMASAAERGDIVVTSDPDDLERLRPLFPGVIVLAL